MDDRERQRVNFVLKDPDQLDWIIKLLDPNGTRSIGRAEVIRNALNLYANVVEEATSNSARLYMGPDPKELKIQLAIPGVTGTQRSG